MIIFIDVGDIAMIGKSSWNTLYKEERYSLVHVIHPYTHTSKAPRLVLTNPTFYFIQTAGYYINIFFFNIIIIIILIFIITTTMINYY